MDLRSYFTLLLSLFVLVSCQKDLPTPTPSQLTPSQKEIIDRADAQVAQVQREVFTLRAAVVQRVPADAVTLPAGSVDGLADAIAAAGEGGTVLIEAGEHLERGTVLITQKVRIVGEEGAVIVSATQPMQIAGVVQAVLHIKDVAGVLVDGVDFRAETDPGGTAILIDHAERTFISNNRMSGFQHGVLNHHGDRSYIGKNEISSSLIWQDGFQILTHGIINMNGDRVRIFNNNISNSVFGVWACDEKGLLFGNNAHSNYMGMILCKVGEFIPMPDGSIVGSEQAGTQWTVLRNTTNNNFHVGLAAIDGGNKSLLLMNAASGNVDAQIELAGPTTRFGGPPLPTSFNNTVISLPGVSVKDCGVDNSVHGGIMIDTDAVPCF